MQKLVDIRTLLAVLANIFLSAVMVLYWSIPAVWTKA